MSLATDILNAEAALNLAVKTAGRERGHLPEGEKADMRYILKQLKAAQPFIERAKRKAQLP